MALALKTCVQSPPDLSLPLRIIAFGAGAEIICKLQPVFG